MKKIFILIMSAAAIYGCSSTDDDGCTSIEPKGDGPVEIKLNANVLDVSTTRGVVGQGNSINAVFVASDTSGTYGTYLWSDTVQFNANPSPAAISFTPAQYYPVNGSTVYLKGYYPAGTITPPNNNVIVYNSTDGSVDLLVAGEQSGNRYTSSPLSFTFNHQLTQLQFRFVAGTGFPTGKTVKRLVIKNAQTYPTQLNLNTGAITYSTDSIVFTGKTYAIGSTTDPIIVDCPMVAAAIPVKLGITTGDNVTYPDFTVGNVTTVVGKSHLITITFNGVQITATVSVANWAAGLGGGSSVQ